MSVPEGNAELAGCSSRTFESDQPGHWVAAYGGRLLAPYRLLTGRKMLVLHYRTYSGARCGGARRVQPVGGLGTSSIHKTRRRKMTVDIDDGKKAEERPGFVAQLQAILNVIPAYTWYAAPSGGLTFVNKRTADYLGLAKDHPLRFGIDIGAQWDAHIPFLHPDDREEARKAGQPVCARARPVSIVFEFVTLKEATAGSSVASNRSGRAMEPYCCGSG